MESTEIIMGIIAVIVIAASMMINPIDIVTTPEEYEMRSMSKAAARGHFFGSYNISILSTRDALDEAGINGSARMYPGLALFLSNFD